MGSSKDESLVQASGAGNLAHVRALLAEGADPNGADRYGMGPLLTFHPEVLRYLLDNGADPDVQRNENIAPVIVGISSSYECLKILVDAGADVNRASDHNGETALHAVAGGQDLRSVLLLLQNGADIHARTIPGMKTYALWRDARVRGETPLHRAAAWGSSEIIRCLLKAGADPARRDMYRDTALSWASWHRRDKAIIDLLSYDGCGVGPDFPQQADSRHA